MLFMVIERFRDNDMVPIYRRLRESGRSLPDGLEYVDSWIEPNFARCFQLMRGDDPRLIQEWVMQWRGLGVTFEIVPAVPSKETQAVVAPYLDHSGGIIGVNTGIATSRGDRSGDRGRQDSTCEIEEDIDPKSAATQLGSLAASEEPHG
jgi:hypothetical protein